MLVGDGSKETNLIYVENLCRALFLPSRTLLLMGKSTI